MMGFADVFLWIVVTAIAFMFSTGTYVVLMLSGRLVGEGWILLAIACAFCYLSYDLWPFQMAMKAVQ